MQGLNLIRRPSKQCVYARAIDTLRETGDPDLDEFLQAVKGGQPASVISKILSLNGVPAGESAIRAHLRGECCCDR